MTERDTVVLYEETTFHMADHPAPLGWARTTGERVSIPGHDGLWCEIVEDQKPFMFVCVNEHEVKVLQGFRNPEKLGAVFPIDMLERGDLDEIRVYMKEHGLPSCTRLNLLDGFRCFEMDPCIPDEGLRGYSLRPYHDYPNRHDFSLIKAHLSYCTLCNNRRAGLFTLGELIQAGAQRINNEAKIRRNAQ